MGIGRLTALFPCHIIEYICHTGERTDWKGRIKDGKIKSILYRFQKQTG